MINVLCFHKFFCVAARYRDTIIDDDLPLHVHIVGDGAMGMGDNG